MSVTISVDQGVDAYMSYHLANSRPNSIKSYKYTLDRFKDLFAETDITKVPEVDVVTFLDLVLGGLKQSTKSNRAGHLSALFNFVSDTFDIDFTNPCSRGIIKKLYKQPRHVPPELLDKEIVDEIIYRADGRDRHMLEFMGRTGMRIGEVLSMRPRHLNKEINTISIEQPKSGRQGEVAYVPQRMMRRVDDYVRENGIAQNDRIFPMSYTTAFRMVKRRGSDVGVNLRPHDLSYPNVWII